MFQMGKYLACQFTKENRLMVYQHQRDAQIINPGRNKITERLQDRAGRGAECKVRQAARKARMRSTKLYTLLLAMQRSPDIISGGKEG